MANSAYLSRTPSSAGNRKTFTYSTWFKRTTTSNGSYGFSAGVAGNSSAPRSYAYFYDDQIMSGFNPSGSQWYDLQTTAKYRDVNAWYHIVVAVDTTQATASDRHKLYVNGERVTVFNVEQYPPQNTDLPINSTVSHTINAYAYDVASYATTAVYAHTHFCDGTQYQASDFGEYDANGVWTPKLNPSVTYGTNGFFLKYENSGSLGTDSSGNANNFTVNGTMTQTLDTPSNVYCTMNPLDNYFASGTFANGNNTITTVNTGYPYNTATMGVNKGKWYWECKWSAQPTGSTNQVLIGIAKRVCPSTTTWLGSVAYTYAYQGTGTVHQSDTTIATYTTMSIGDIIGVALDLDNNRLYFSKNGTWQGSSDPANGTNPISITAPDSTSGDSGFYFPAFGDGNNSLQETGQFNFGNGTFGTTSVASAGSNGNGSIFEYDVPSGYYALNTKNLATYG